MKRKCDCQCDESDHIWSTLSFRVCQCPECSGIVLANYTFSKQKHLSPKEGESITVDCNRENWEQTNRAFWELDNKAMKLCEKYKLLWWQ